ETFGISNDEFIGELEEFGFSISEEARSNYNKTWPTLASALNGQYLDELVGDRPIPPDAESQIRWLHALIEEASMLDALRERGYRIRTLPPPFVSAALTSA